MRDMPNAAKKTRVVGYDPHRPTANSAARRKDMMDPYYSMVSSLFSLDSDELEACFLDASRVGVIQYTLSHLLSLTLTATCNCLWTSATCDLHVLESHLCQPHVREWATWPLCVSPISESPGYVSHVCKPHMWAHWCMQPPSMWAPYNMRPIFMSM